MFKDIPLLRDGERWEDPKSGHVVMCGDATKRVSPYILMAGEKDVKLAIHDPPYNIQINEQSNRRDIGEYIKWSA